MRNIVSFAILCFPVLSQCIMLKKECPPDETHRSCSFFEEYTCWETTSKERKVMLLPQRLQHCRSGCFCRRGSVRAYPHGHCISASFCRNQRVVAVLSKLPQ